MYNNKLINYSINKNTAVNSFDQLFSFDNCSYEISHVRRATAKILNNIGFSTASKSCILILSSIFKKYYEMLSATTYHYANFGLFVFLLYIFNFYQNKNVI